jgi:hypothetical protein
VVHVGECEPFFYIESAGEDDEYESVNLRISISLLMITGVRISDTMQLVMHVGERELVTLLDSGSSHNFINDEFPRQVCCHFSTGCRLRVSVPNRDLVRWAKKTLLPTSMSV